MPLDRERWRENLRKGKRLRDEREARERADRDRQDEADRLNAMPRLTDEDWLEVMGRPPAAPPGS